MQDRNWRHWTGTAFMAAAIVAFVFNLIDPASTDGSSTGEVAFYGVGLVLLGVGWWLRRSSQD